MRSGFLTEYEQEVCESCFEHKIKQMQMITPGGVYPCDNCEIHKSRKRMVQMEHKENK